jgi:hypothetical protein
MDEAERPGLVEDGNGEVLSQAGAPTLPIRQSGANTIVDGVSARGTSCISGHCRRDKDRSGPPSPPGGAPVLPLPARLC